MQLGWHSGIDAIVPVPLHPEKEAARGYNQSVLIAEGMSEVLNIPVLEKALQRTKNTESQTQKTREQRIENMQSAFSVPNAPIVQGKHLLLVDDVLTTGATLEACALALKTMPSVNISIATIGIAS